MRTTFKEKMESNDQEEIKINMYGCKIFLSPILFLLLFHTFLSFIQQIPHQFLLHAAYMDFPIQALKNYIRQYNKIFIITLLTAYISGLHCPSFSYCINTVK